MSSAMGSETRLPICSHSCHTELFTDVPRAIRLPHIVTGLLSATGVALEGAAAEVEGRA